ncbi:MAG: DUF4299 family protein, partial [Erysipelotrichales bacterium]
MSVSLKFVDYNGIFKQKHDFTTYDLYNTLGDLVVLEADYFGTFSLVEDVVELGDTHHTIYQSNKMCSRGFGLSVNEAQNTFDFNLYFPATTADIDLMFRFIKEFVKSLNEPKFYIDNDEVYYSYIDDINKDLVKENQRIILELKDEKDFIITGKDYPFYLDEYFLQSIKDEEDIDFVRKVEEYMYEQQEIDAYFARPYVVLENDDATEAVPVFSMGSDIPFLFYYDKKTYVIPFQDNINF